MNLALVTDKTIARLAKVKVYIKLNIC
jgi:hypothetical protein